MEYYNRPVLCCQSLLSFQVSRFPSSSVSLGGALIYRLVGGSSTADDAENSTPKSQVVLTGGSANRISLILHMCSGPLQDAPGWDAVPQNRFLS